MNRESSLPSRLAAALPVGLQLQVYHLSTPATATSALFAPLPGREEELTSCESHFLTVSSPQHDDSKPVLLYAVEVLIIVSNSLTTLFVSKADSSGFLSRLGPTKHSPSVVATITTAFVEFLLVPRLASSRVVISLFARSQNQYLFPGSSENAAKHILDDRQLIKWWCRVLDKILRHPRCGSTTTAHLLVPGCDRSETRAYFPLTSRVDPPDQPKWIASYPVELLVTDPSVPPRHLIPRLPDDPKARFLVDLDGESVDEAGKWRSVKSLAQFWELMSYRQECAAGRLVGFLWLVVSQGQGKHTALAELEQSNELPRSNMPMAQSGLATPGNSQQLENGTVESGPPETSTLEMLPELHSPPSSSPLRQEPVSHAIQNGVTTDEAPAPPPPSKAPTFPTVEETQGEILMGVDQYETLMDHLLQTDFAGDELAIEASKSWVDKALELSKATSFGQTVVGSAEPIVVPAPLASDASSAPARVLTGIRKKRKAVVVEDGAVPCEATGPTPAAAVNTLSAGLVKKKPKS